MKKLSACTNNLAEKLLALTIQNEEVTQGFEKKLISLVSKSFRWQIKRNVEKKCGPAIMKSRFSRNIQLCGKNFSLSLTVRSLLSFLPVCTHYMLEELLKKHHPLPEKVHEESTFEEINGNCYASGWVVRAVSKKIKK